MFLTIAIPLYNEEKRLPVMLESLEKQDWSLFEVRFSDDGSTDNARDLVAAFAERHPGQVFYSWHENEGQALCRNRMIPEAAGDYMWFCDGDDAIAPGSVAAIHRCIKGSNCDILAFIDGLADKVMPRLDSEPIELSPTEAVIAIRGSTWARVFRTAFLREKNIVFPGVKYMEDSLFGVRAACLSSKTLFWFEKPYLYYRRQGSATGILHSRYIREALECIKSYDDIAEEFPEFRRAVQYQKLSSYCFLVNRLEIEAPRELREECLPEVWECLSTLALSRDNPILNLPYGLSMRYRHAIAGRRAAEERVNAIKNSLSWRITAPLRAVIDLVTRR